MEHQTPFKNSERGTKIRIARELGITHGAVSQWQKVPAERVLDVERITGIPRHELRPDIYPLDQKERSK